MKKKLKCTLSWLLCLTLLIVSIPASVNAAGTAVLTIDASAYSAGVDTSTVTSVVLPIKTEATNVSVADLDVTYESEVFESVSAELASGIAGSVSLSNGALWWEIGDEDPVQNISGEFVILTFVLKSGAKLGDTTVSVTGTMTDDEYEDIDVSATTTLSVKDKIVAGYTAQVTAPAEVTAGTDFVVNVGVGHNEDDTFHAAEIVLEYDAAALTLKNISETQNLKYTNANGVLTVENFDEEHTMGTGVYTFTFTANANAGNSDTTVTLKSAKFLDKAAASSSDLIDATEIEPNAATIKINEVTYTVTTAEGSVITGLTIPTEVTKGTDLVINAESTNLWDYTVKAKIGDTDVAVTGPVDGKFTIAANNITGNIVLTTSRSGHEFAVVWDGLGEADVTKPEGKPTYNEDYIFTVPGRIDATAEEAGVTYSATVSIAGSSYSASAEAGQTVTIPGAEIIGDVTIYVDKIDLPANGKTVSITGEDVKFSDGTTSKVVSPGTQLTLNLTVEPGYSYSVKIGDQEIMNNTTTTYTLTVGDSGVTITVSKDLITENLVQVYDYLTLDSQKGEKLWLVTFTPTLAEDKIPTYDSAAMFWSEVDNGGYGAYCYLVKATSLTVDSAAAELGTTTATAVEISYNGEINNTTIRDAADAQFVANMYNAMYKDMRSDGTTDTTNPTMAMFLSADVNNDKKVSVLDAEKIVKMILGRND